MRDDETCVHCGFERECAPVSGLCDGCEGEDNARKAWQEERDTLHLIIAAERAAHAKTRERLSEEANAATRSRRAPRSSSAVLARAEEAERGLVGDLAPVEIENDALRERAEKAKAVIQRWADQSVTDREEFYRDLYALRERAEKAERMHDELLGAWDEVAKLRAALAQAVEALEKVAASACKDERCTDLRCRDGRLARAAARKLLNPEVKP